MKHYVTINRTIGTIIEFQVPNHKAAKRRLARLNRLHSELLSEPGRLEFMGREEREAWLAEHPVF